MNKTRNGLYEDLKASPVKKERRSVLRWSVNKYKKKRMAQQQS